jgi:D-alanyl-D-alanine carboxypeptidase
LLKKRTKRVVLNRTDHRINIGPAGRNLFISRDKQQQSRQARRIQLWMRFVMGLGVLVIAAGVGMFVAFYMVPYFQSEMILDSSSASETASGSQVSSVEIPTYDDMGLPLYSNEVSLFVINQKYPQDETYVPNTVECCDIQVEAHIASALEMLSEAAKADGLALVFTEGYVSYQEQEQRYNEKVDELMETESLTTVMARTQAKLVVPVAGECDQQTGMCVRVQGDPETFTDSQTFTWLRSNMGKYGFVFRYPEGKDDYTGCTADYTLIRYVGSDNATAMQQRSMCLEEYISYLNSQ